MRETSDASNLSAENLDSDMRQSTSTTTTSSTTATDTSASPDTSKLQDDMKKLPNSKLGDKAKKKAWYSAIYPSYKSRSEDFKKLFKLPEDERLLVGKEKVAKVIPNAILMSTESEKHFLTSFTSRDKTYLMLFRVWQNALMDTPMNPPELWQWVHTCYGEQLGLTSDDEDYIDPTNYEDRDNFNSADSEEFEAKASTSSLNKLTNAPDDFKKLGKNSSSSSSSLSKQKIAKASSDDNKVPTEAVVPTPLQAVILPSDMSDSSESDCGKKMETLRSYAECNSIHEGRQLVHTILPLNIDTLFALMFTNKSKFFSEFHKMRKTTNLMQGEWDEQEDGTKKRIQKLTVAITQLVGPKAAHVTETQIMRPCSIPGQLYSIDGVSENAGIPYADSFYVLLHYCMKRTVDDSTVMSVHAQIKYKKSVWGVVKGFIEKNTWLGLEDFYDSLSQALLTEYNIPPAKAKRRNRKSTASHAGQILPNNSNTQTSLPAKQAQAKDDSQYQMAKQMNVHGIRQVQSVNERANTGNRQERLSWILIILLITLISFNVILYAKLLKLDDFDTHEILSKSSSPKTTTEWLQLMKLQEKLHVKEMHKWQDVIHSAIELLKKTENSLENLQNLIFAYRSKSNNNNNRHDIGS